MGICSEHHGALKKLNVIYMVNLRRILFIKKMMINYPLNVTLMGILKSYIMNNEFQTVLNKYKIDFTASINNITKRVQLDFISSCQGNVDSI